MSQRIRYTVHGTVQGVNFRNTTVRQARQLAITGFVQNDASGTVSGEAQGEPAKMQDFVRYLHQGPTHAWVERVEQSDVAVENGETGFEVR